MGSQFASVSGHILPAWPDPRELREAGAMGCGVGTAAAGSGAVRGSRAAACASARGGGGGAGPDGFALAGGRSVGVNAVVSDFTAAEIYL